MVKILIATSAVIVAIAAFIYCIIYVVPNLAPAIKSPLHCQHVRKAKEATQNLSKRVTPPWFSLPKKKTLYVWSCCGGRMRLGNRLFLYATIFGIAWHVRRHPILLPSLESRPEHDLPKYFNIATRVDHDNNISKSKDTRAITLKEVGPAVFDVRLTRLPARNVTIWGFLQSYKYFQEVEDQLRIDLTFKRSVLDEARKWLTKQTPKKWKELTFVRILIHVRRTDHISPLMQRNGWPSATLDYFRRSMSYFASCLERILFVVLSDDIAWCRKHIHATDIVYSSGKSPVVDMAIASLCDHAIITVGSFGWWAAWFANGITITQKNLPVENSTLAKRWLHRRDYYKPEWIGL